MIMLELVLHLLSYTTVEWACSGNSYELMDPKFNRWEKCVPILMVDSPLVEMTLDPFAPITEE